MFGLVPFRRRTDDLSIRSNPFDFMSIFDDFFNEPFTPAFFAPSNPIRADISETDKEYILEADMPGARKEDIKLELRDDVLTIGVEHKEENDIRKDNYVRRERRYGSYCRSFRVDGVDQGKVTASYKDGVLKVVLPKLAEAKPNSHRIEIQ